MGSFMPPAAIYWINAPIEFQINSDGTSVASFRSGDTVIELRSSLETTLQSYVNVQAEMENFRREQGRLALAAEIKVIPLCELCVRYDLPKHDEDKH